MRLIRLLRPYWRELLLALFLAALPAAAQAALPPLLVKPLLDEVLAEGRYDQLRALLGVAAGLLGLVALGGYAQEAFMGYLSVRVPRELRERIQARLLQADLARLPAAPAALAGRILADLRELESFIFFGLGALLVQGALLLALLVALLVLYPKLTLALVALLPPLWLLFGWVGRRVAAASGRTQAAAERVAGRLAEGFSRLELIRAQNLADFARERFRQESRAYYRLGLARALTAALHLPLSQLATAVVALALLWLGARAVEAGAMTTGDLTAYLTYLGLAVSPMQTLSRAGMLFAQAEGAAARLVDLLHLPETPPSGGYRPERLEGRIEFREVRFAYPEGRAALEGVTFTLEPGTLNALVGPSGAGKSTVLRLILGLYRPAAGEVRLDGRPLWAYDLELVRRVVAWVPQEPAFFGGTVRENLEALAPGVSAAAMREALETVQLWEELSAGLETPVHEETGGLSVGQKQRLAIAAALLRDARVLLLDEVTSALDPISEARVLTALEAARAGRTVLVVAHRLHTVRQADRILVMQAGRVVETGTHAELVARGGLYTRLTEQLA
ncbi:ABC transporter ATP-binding protein [Marinithermus hydrothermalis]|uniref:Xenobiotic-transporting ATPase n=1 Tax=Marinithermus hydrothermalis (strain DSM 14884 / JCM 11576 / T1) TaxID=869210 RepID=F2NPZ9_MARHT|nr:ABC transporter ATP-binding protein [Marinithermus hydrothermalis]AEB11100.1 Xenobiotic-transporting ATPase [Marinithermus hydrothermalis DSM 14884]